MQYNISNKWKLAAAGLIALYGGVAVAAQVGTLNSFTAGSPAVAADVNANFTTVTNAVNDNDSRLATLEAKVNGTKTVNVDCANGGTIAGGLSQAPLSGGVTLNISGTCNENVVIKRNKVKLQSTTGGSIVGATTAPTLKVNRGSSRISVIGLTIGGGSDAVLVAGNAELLIQNATIGDANTLNSGLMAQKGAVVTAIGNYDGTGGSTFNAGSSGNGAAVVAYGALVHFKDGSNTINGGTGVAMAADLGAEIVSGDLTYSPAATINGLVMVNSNSVFSLDNGSITGDINAFSNVTVDLEPDVDGTTTPVSVTGGINASYGSMVHVTGGATVSGAGTAATGSVISVDTASSIGSCTATDGISACQ